MSGGEVLERWNADRGAYIRGHLLLAVVGSVVTFALLVAIGNADPWVGPLGVVLALAVRGVYLASEELALSWDLTADRLVSSDGRSVALGDVVRVRRLGSAVQVVTRGGDKYLLRHLAAPDEAQARIARAAGVEAG